MRENQNVRVTYPDPAAAAFALSSKHLAANSKRRPLGRSNFFLITWGHFVSYAERVQQPRKRKVMEQNPYFQLTLLGGGGKKSICFLYFFGNVNSFLCCYVFTHVRESKENLFKTGTGYVTHKKPFVNILTVIPPLYQKSLLRHKGQNTIGQIFKSCSQYYNCVGARSFHYAIRLLITTAATTVYCSWYNFSLQHNNQLN